MAKHDSIPQWKWWLLLGGACVLVAGVVLGLWRLWPDSPAESPAASPAQTTTHSTDTTTSATSSSVTEETQEQTTTEPFTTTTAAPKVMLEVTSHKAGTTSTNEPITTFTGTSDPQYALKINGKTVERDEDGAFSVEYELKPGNNTFTFSHKGKDTTYTVKYNYVVMQSYTPSGSQRYNSGATFSVVVSAREGSTVTATFRGKTITLKRTTGEGGDGETQKSETFVDYTGTFSLPSDNTTDKNLGTVTFKATHQGQTDTARSGSIVCKKSQKGVIGEVVAFSAETFNGDKNDDDSRPTNNYFPKGTVDYVVGHTYFGEKEYLLLRCGRRVYVNKELSPPKQTVTVTKQYAGELPDTNQLSLDAIRVTSGATYITLNTNWKAPFFLDLKPQSYKDPSTQDYRVTGVTAQYVEITFCYATKVTGNFTFDSNHPLFTKATVQKSGDATVLRLYLRRTGGFYGWDAYYNSDGQLEFYFLHPAQVKTAGNAYGADLTGVTVMLDVGHGYTSGGASGLDSLHPEGERNYYLATLIKRELESIGATVILNRTATGDLDQDERCMKLKNVKPDLCIAIHHDANASSKPNGFGAFYSLSYAYEPAKYIYNATMDTGIYKSSTSGNRNRLDWHYYFVARMSDCPVVLTENGFMTSRIDHQGIVSDLTNWNKAKAITKGVAQYFLSIRIAGYTSSSTTSTTVKTTATTKVTTSSTAVTTTTTTHKVVVMPTMSTTVSTTASAPVTTASTSGKTEETATSAETSTDTTAPDTTATEETTDTGDTSQTESTTAAEPTSGSDATDATESTIS